MQGGKRILVAGSINTDLVVRTRRAPEAGETVTGTEFAIFGGGKGANQAVAAARSGGQVAMLSGVGEDDFGRQRLLDLEAEGVSTATILRTAAASSGVAQITVDETGQNRIAYVPGAGWEVAPAAALEALDAWNPDIVLSTLELRHETLQTLYEAAKARNVTIICNGTPEPSEGRDLVEHATVLIVNESEALELAGTGAGRGWEDVAGELAKLGPETVILTLGPDGALVWHNGEAARVNTIPVEVVDTTGAGDAFCGAFASFYANGMSPIDATARAVIAGTISATRPGAQPSVPTLHEIEDAFASSRIDQQ